MSRPHLSLSWGGVLSAIALAGLGGLTLYQLSKHHASVATLTAVTTILSLVVFSLLAAFAMRMMPASGTENDGEGELQEESRDIISRLDDRNKLMEVAIRDERLPDGAAVVLQRPKPTSTAGSSSTQKKQTCESATEQTCDQANRAENFETGNRGEDELSPLEKPSKEDIAGTVRYRLAVADLFVEKAQYHLERRAERYEYLGVGMYGAATVLFASGAALAVYRMMTYEIVIVKSPGDPKLDLLARFILSFTAYGLIVSTAVVLARGARACLDQRERLLAKRHSLRQGRLYLHLTGGHLSIEEMERAFNWNHSQTNAFTQMLTDTKAPFGALSEELVKIVPDLVKTGVEAANGATGKGKS